MSYYVYPVIKTNPECDDYIVKINGCNAALNTARVSAVPINRRWPGHQRQIEQSESVQFLSLSADSPLTLEIIPKRPFTDVKIRPASLGIKPLIHDGKIQFTLDKPAYFTVEPYGRSHALHVFADPVAEYDIDPADPDVLYYGPGEHDAGMITLTSGQTLFLDEGAVVYACVRANDAENIRILGRGILDNSKNKETILFEANEENNTAAVDNAVRLHTVEFHYCKNVTIDGITIRDSLVYNIRPICCDNLTITHVKIIGCWRFNSDGIDMHNCTGVHISDCFLRTFDDSVCIKGFDCYNKGNVEEAVRKLMYHNGRVYDVFRDVLVENCVIWNDWGRALEIGAETKAEEICDITFRNCDLIHLTHAALDCLNVDYADVHDVTYKNINIECDEIIPAPVIQKNDGETYENPKPDYMPPTLSAAVIYHQEYSAGTSDRRGKNRNFCFENIRVIGDKKPRVVMKGFDHDHKTENITIRNLIWNDTLMKQTEEIDWAVNEYCANIHLEADPYAQMSKNTVDSADQLRASSCVRFTNPEGRGKRIMFVGNSITLHGIAPAIGWYRECGMAASSAEKDYVHILQNELHEVSPDAAFCICQVSGWESDYKNGDDRLSAYQAAREFCADIIVIRMIENCKRDDYDGEIFLRRMDALIQYLNQTGSAKIIISTGFWHHPGDNDLRAYAEERGLVCVELGDLGEDDQMKAVGLFQHKGVSNHPGDLGMRHIAERLLVPLKKLMQE